MLGEASYDSAITRIHDLRGQRVPGAKCLDAAGNQRANASVAQADLATDLSVDLCVCRLHHQLKDVINTLARNYADERRVQQVALERERHRVVENRFARLVLERGY